MAHVERAPRLQIHLLREASVSRHKQLQLVITRRDTKTLEGAVEVVHHAGEEAVDVDLGFPRHYLETNRRTRVVKARTVERICGIRVSISVPGVPVPISVADPD